MAQRYYKEAIELLDTGKKDHFQVLYQLYMQKGRLNYYLGKFSESAEVTYKALYFLRQTNESPYELAILNEQIADAHYMLKDYENALISYQNAFDIFSKQLPGNHYRIINLHTDLAATYKGLEDYDHAIQHFRIAAENSKLSPYQYRVFGETLWKARQLDEAEKMLKLANSEAESKKKRNATEIADTHFWLGSFYLQTGRDKLLGLYYLNLAVGEYRSSLGEKNESLGRAQLALAKYFIQINDTEKALEIIQSSIISLTPGFSSMNPFDNPDGIQMSLQSVANSLGWKALALAKHYEKTKILAYLRASFETYQLSIKMVEGFRFSQKYNSNLILNNEVNNLLNQAILVSYKLYTITKEPQYFDATFSFIEQNKSTALLASLKQNDSLRLSNVPTELIEKENLLKQNLISLDEKMNPLDFTSKTLDEKLIRVYQLQKQIFKNSLDSIQQILYTDYPEYYRLFYGNNVISISDVQEQLNRNKVLIDFALTDSLMIAYVISNKQASLYTKKIPPGFENGILRLLQLIQHVNTENSASDYQSFIKLAFENYQFLLGDFASIIEGKELLIVPDGILSYLPFDVLLTDTIAKPQPDYRKLHYFINKNISSTLNSAAIYFSYAEKKKLNYGEIIAFAPEYFLINPSDSTIKSDYALMPLPHVKRELESISTNFTTEIYRGTKATKIKFLNAAPKASVLHLAMHTVLDDKDPLNSHLVFANANDTATSGLFTVGELFGMELSADLAVLSACNSGNGKLNKGEGIMSLSTGFQYAGVPSVVMTHWDVNDKYSADLISGFYTYLAQGLDKNMALHKAKLDLINRGSAMYAHPYYWAGFTLIGNESAIVSRKSGFGKSLEFAIPILVLFAFFFRLKKKSNG
ncbi:MAG: CHAT domain-containing protein, partial [Bacteroidales bacterium]|nr:CHAT domain-containing protein [Bacteroidales bacterium]